MRIPTQSAWIQNSYINPDLKLLPVVASRDSEPPSGHPFTFRTPIWPVPLTFSTSSAPTIKPQTPPSPQICSFAFALCSITPNSSSTPPRLCSCQRDKNHVSENGLWCGPPRLPGEISTPLPTISLADSSPRTPLAVQTPGSDFAFLVPRFHHFSNSHGLRARGGGGVVPFQPSVPAQRKGRPC